MQIEHEGSLPRDTQQMDADKVLEDPAGRRILNGSPFVSGEGGLVGLECLPEALLQGGIDQHADSHHPEQRHAPFRVLEIERGG